ncbi:MAG: hypothetical protein ABSF69_00360 [Polyangiaceae bacterium]|jgi:tetratricopeptide (TPR) repeat protein
MICARAIALVLHVAGAAVLVPGLARADGERTGESTAQSLFLEGRALVDAGRFSEAAEDFSASLRFDPAPGTMANLAFCYAKMGKIASAWITYKEAARTARERGRLDWATRAEESAAELEKSAPRVVIEVRYRSAIESLVIWLDETPLPNALWNEAPPVSPGRHRLRASAPDKQPWSTEFEVDATHAAAISVPELEPTDLAYGPSPEAPPQSPPVAVAATRRGQNRRNAGVAMGGAGAAALALGALLAVVSKVTYAATSGECGTRVCDSQGASRRTAAISELNAATIALAVGGAAVAGGAVLLLTAPRASVGIGPEFGRTELGVTLRGGF